MVDVKNLVEYIVGQLVDDPSQITVTASGDEVKVLVKKPDMGKVIGRQGRIAKAIRTVVRAVGMKENRKINVEIDEIDVNGGE